MQLDRSIIFSILNKITTTALYSPINVHGVGFLWFAFRWKVHNNWCSVEFQLQNYIKLS